MQIVININDLTYESIMRHPNTLKNVGAEFIRNGIPLPKGHRRIIDIDDMLDFFGYDAFGEVERGNIEFYIEHQGAIIEADVESEVSE